jgi:putative heme iron utilization protein
MMQADDATGTARQVLRAASTAALGTLDETGAPFVTLVTVATDHDGTALCLMSRLAVHTANLAADARASLLLGLPIETDGNPLTSARLTLSGRFEPVDETVESEARGRFLARHPEAADYASFVDFRLRRLRPDHAHLVAGFGRVSRVPGERLLVEPGVAAVFASAGPGVVAELDRDTGGTLARLAGARFARRSGWRTVALDADGVDIAFDLDGAEAVRHLAFRTRLETPAAVRAELEAMAADLD